MRLNPIWKVGLDTATESGEQVARIIRTGGTKKPSNEKLNELKVAYNRFPRIFKMLPQEALTFLVVNVATSLGLSRMLGLTNKGAYDLSTKRHPHIGADYDKLHSRCGFLIDGNSNWGELVVTDDNSKSISEGRLKGGQLDGLNSLIASYRDSRSPYTGMTAPRPIDLSTEALMVDSERSAGGFRNCLRSPYPLLR